MKKLLIVSVVLIAVGLVLILYSDPVLTASGSESPQGAQTLQMSSASGNPGGGSGLTPPGNCTTQSNGAVACSGLGGPAGLSADAQPFTLVGIVLCGIGLAMTVVESVSKTRLPEETKAVA